MLQNLWIRGLKLLAIMRYWMIALRLLISFAAWSPSSSLNLQSSRRLFSIMKHFSPSLAPCTSTPSRVNHSTYSLRFSFLSWTMAFNVAMVFGCFCLTLKWEVNSSHYSLQELIDSSSCPLTKSWRHLLVSTQTTCTSLRLAPGGNWGRYLGVLCARPDRWCRHRSPASTALWKREG